MNERVSHPMSPRSPLLPKALPALAALVLALVLGLAPGTSVAAQAAALRPHVETPSLTEIVKRYVALGEKGVWGDPSQFVTEPRLGAGYTPGALSPSTTEQATRILNFYRFLAGVPSNVVLDPALNAEAQLGALANAANDALGHYPTRVPWMSDEDWTVAANACRSSNLGWGHTTFGRFIASCMDDGDPGNKPMVGHRRWFLNPLLDRVGWGNVGSYWAAKVFSQGGQSTASSVCWPAQTQLVEAWTTGSPWSIAVGSPVDAGAITVTLTRQSDQRTWRFSQSGPNDGTLYVNNEGYAAPGCIIFDPTDLSERPGDRFSVTVEGLGDAHDDTLAYSVGFWGVIDEVPEAWGPIVYNGESHSPLDAAALERAGIEIVDGGSAVDAGAYEVRIQPMDGYRWEDGSEEIRTVPWTIEKAPTTLGEASPIDDRLAEGGDDLRIPLEVGGMAPEAAELEASADVPGVVDLTIQGAQLTLEPLRAGTVTVTVTLPESANYLGTSWSHSFEVAPPIDMYRLYNPFSGEHLYTASPTERNAMVAGGWRNEGVMWRAPERSSSPVWRLYNPHNGDHHYARTQDEYDALQRQGWRGEGVVFYSAGDDGVPIYRLFNPYTDRAGAHHYTGQASERDANVSQGWRYEDVGWYGVR